MDAASSGGGTQATPPACEHVYERVESYTAWLRCTRCDDHVSTEMMLADLLRDETLFANEGFGWWDEKREKPTLVLLVNCNDVFAWACAEGEEVTPEELPDLWLRWRKDPRNGPVKWASAKRRQPPQMPLVERMREEGAWDDEMEGILRESESRGPAPA